MTTRRAVCPGSYDPITHGHLDVIDRARSLFDEVIVAVLHNPAKKGVFEVEERIALVERSVAQLPVPPGAGSVRVEQFGGRLLVDVCREVGAGVILKGLRNSTDFDYELPMALMNRHLTGVETVLLPGDPRWQHVSSSLVKEVARYGGDISGLLPDAVHDALLKKLRAEG